MDRCSDIEGTLAHLTWMEGLSESLEYSTSPRVGGSPGRLRTSTCDESGGGGVRVVSWCEFSSSSASLAEWDDEIQFYEEKHDEFRKWATRYKLQFETVSLLRSLRLDDLSSLGAINHYQMRLLRGSVGFDDLSEALKSLHISTNRWDELGEDEVLGDAEYSLKPRITRNMPLRRSTRSAKKSKRGITVRGNGIQTIGPGASRSAARSAYHNRRLSWEAFAFLNSKSPPPAGSPNSSTGSGNAATAVTAATLVQNSPKSAKIVEQFKFVDTPGNSTKREGSSSKRTKNYFPSVTPM